MGLLKRIFNLLSETHFKYIFGHSKVRVSKDSVAEIGRDVSIKNSQIFICNNSKLVIADGTTIKDAIIYCNNGSISLGEQNIILGKTNKDKLNITIDSGHLTCNRRVKISLKRIWIRFNGECNIGEYTNINYNSEIRADLSVNIGSYCQISYDVNIWDTNTHSILPPDERRKVAVSHWPFYGFEETRPDTKPIVIGDFCWLGEHSSIFKGTYIGNNVIVGFGTLISGKTIPDNSKVITNRELRIL